MGLTDLLIFFSLTFPVRRYGCSTIHKIEKSISSCKLRMAYGHIVSVIKKKGPLEIPMAYSCP